MKKTNTILDREPMSSEAIQARQDFNYILRQTAASKVPLWKSVWFYGPVGIAMVTMVVSAVRMNPKNEEYENKTTLAQNNVIGYNVSINGSAINSSDSYTMEDAPKAAIEKSSAAKEENTKVARTQATVKTSKVDQNTPLKPEVFTEEEIKVAPAMYPVVPVKTVKKIDATMPSVAGVFSGRVAVNDICGAGRIVCNNGFQIISYDIQYENAEGPTVDRVLGDQIPDHVCANLKRYNVGSPVFITKIIAMNEKGERKTLLSMNLEPTF